mmetsp:Transcript_4392/g.9291  ORF Transcript_4392/g.9291 Transcript_4392/m.9291 type:complete len:327 (-) Transcript_4392:489-1469(-)
MPRKQEMSVGSGSLEMDTDKEPAISLAAHTEGILETRAALRSSILSNSVDVYKQVHTTETPEMITRGLENLRAALDELPAFAKVGWRKALDRCPELVGTKHRLMFLRCEVFMADRAAYRLVKYWDKRIEIYGEGKAFQRLTISQSLGEDAAFLSLGHVQANKSMVDSSGRRILFVLPPSKLSKENKKSMVRAVFYLLQSILEEEMTQKRGVVVLAFPQGKKLSDLPGDRANIQEISKHVMKILPLRVAAFHICRPPWFQHLVLICLKLYLGPRLASRIKEHHGSNEEVLQKLESYGIMKESVPTVLGGDVVLDNESWLEDRKKIGL